MIPRPSIGVMGSGIAARTIEKFAERCGYDTIVASDRPNFPPAWLLNHVTIKLLRDTLNTEVVGFPIDRHRILWGKTESYRKDRSYVVDPRQFIAVESRSNAVGVYNQNKNPDILIDTRHPKSMVKYLSFGNRVALTCVCESIAPRRQTDLESLQDRWVFRLPIGPGRCMVQVVVPQAPCHGTEGDVIAESLQLCSFQKWIGPPVSQCEVFKVAGHLAQIMESDGVVCAGSAALRVDPICGDGVGYAIRSAAWAFATARNIIHNNTKSIEAYRYRLSRTLRAHVDVILDTYQSANFDKSWNEELEILLNASDALEGASGYSGDLQMILDDAKVPVISGAEV